MSLVKLKDKVGNSSADRHARNYVKSRIGQTLVLAIGLLTLQPNTELIITDYTEIENIHHVKVTDGSNEYTIRNSNFYKPDIGRAGKNPTIAENVYLNELSNRIQVAKMQMSCTYITVHTTHGSIDISDVAKVPGVPKADFVLLYPNNQPSFFISHKAGKDTNDFQQFGGVSKFSNNQIVINFKNAVTNEYPNGIEVKRTVGALLKTELDDHRDLAQRAMYGYDFGGPYGKNNVHEIHQGDIILVQNNYGYNLVSNHIFTNGTIPDIINLMIYARFASDRNDLGLKNTRILIGPSNGRKVDKYYDV